MTLGKEKAPLLYFLQLDLCMVLTPSTYIKRRWKQQAGEGPSTTQGSQENHPCSGCLGCLCVRVCACQCGAIRQPPFPAAEACSQKPVPEADRRQDLFAPAEVPPSHCWRPGLFHPEEPGESPPELLLQGFRPWGRNQKRAALVPVPVPSPFHSRAPPAATWNLEAKRGLRARLPGAAGKGPASPGGRPLRLTQTAESRGGRSFPWVRRAPPAAGALGLGVT